MNITAETEFDFNVQKRFSTDGVRDLYQLKMELWARNDRSI
jgi:hypothetical protein